MSMEVQVLAGVGVEVSKQVEERHQVRRQELPLCQRRPFPADGHVSTFTFVTTQLGEVRDAALILCHDADSVNKLLCFC